MGDRAYPITFLGWVNSSEQRWVISSERLRLRMIKLHQKTLLCMSSPELEPNSCGKQIPSPHSAFHWIEFRSWLRFNSG